MKARLYYTERLVRDRYPDDQEVQDVLERLLRLRAAQSEFDALREGLEAEVERLRQKGAAAYRVAIAETPFEEAVAAEINQRHLEIADRLTLLLKGKEER